LESEPCWIEVNGPVYLNQKIVAATGEPHLLVDLGLLESALARPRNLWEYGEKNIALLAASLLFGVARNHPFSQGNKRTAWYTMIGFLGANSFRLELEDDERVVDAMIMVLEGRATEEQFAENLQRVITYVEMRPWV